MSAMPIRLYLMSALPSLSLQVVILVRLVLPTRIRLYLRLQILSKTMRVILVPVALLTNQSTIPYSGGTLAEQLSINRQRKGSAGVVNFIVLISIPIA